MFSLFKKDPIKKLNKKYNTLLEQALQAQRNGDIRLYSSITAEADELLKNIRKLESGKKA